MTFALSFSVAALNSPQLPPSLLLPYASRLAQQPANSDHCADIVKIMEMKISDRCDAG
jgi:hypothetical protein